MLICYKLWNIHVMDICMNAFMLANYICCDPGGVPKAQGTKAKAKVQSPWDGHGISRTSLGPRMKGWQPFGSWGSENLSLKGANLYWTGYES